MQVSNIAFDSLIETYLVDREDKELAKGPALITGGTSGCRSHIRSSHYEEYSKRCKEANIPEHEHAVPFHILEARKSASTKVAQQTQLAFKASKMPKAFTPEGILRAVAVHIVCNNEVSDCSSFFVLRFTSLSAVHVGRQSYLPQYTGSNATQDEEERDTFALSCSEVY